MILIKCCVSTRQIWLARWVEAVDCPAETCLLIAHWCAVGARESELCLAGINDPGKGSERLFREQENGLGVGDCLPRIGLAKAFFDLCQKAELFDRIFKRGSIRKPLHNLKDLLLDRFSGHCNYLVRLAL